jgi:tetratricopeptide (TPR) repeat protein
MKKQARCSQSFADGFTFCPKDAARLERYDLWARVQHEEEFNFLLEPESLLRRLKRELVSAVGELRGNPSAFLRGLARGNGATRYTCVLFCLLCLTTLARAQTSRAASAASYLERGNEWFAKGEWDRAIADYNLAIAFDARGAVAYHNRGLARHRKGDLAGAISDYNRAVELNPRYADVYLNRGAVHAAQGQYNAAIGDFSKAIEINPRDTRAWNNRGVALLIQGRLKEAEADFARCRALGGTLTPEAEQLLREVKGRRVPR